jgi:hypothetical protein
LPRIHPRPDKPREHPRGERSDRPDRPRRADRNRNVDEQVLALRETGQSYSAVARSLELKRSMDAHAACMRALRSLPASERVAPSRRESGRLDTLEARIRARDVGDPLKLARRLEALGVLRQALVDATA